uniref:Uncharacterized protein n=1 Tax=Electrophorus electricus TaxID=8005 RepID=A0A4W4EVV4_ELEEL
MARNLGPGCACMWGPAPRLKLELRMLPVGSLNPREITRAWQGKIWQDKPSLSG